MLDNRPGRGAASRVGIAMRLLSLEDDAGFVTLLVATLRAEGLEAEIDRVDTEAAFCQALARGGYDVIVADYSLPQYDGLAALRLARTEAPDVPFLFVSGLLGEDLAIESLRSGATDYILKGNLSRLAPALRRAVAEAASHRERRRAERSVRQHAELLNLARDAILVLDPADRVEFWNHGAEALYGWTAREAEGQPFPALSGMESSALGLVRQFLGTREDWSGELHQKRRNGEALVVNARCNLVRRDGDPHAALFMIATDVTERKRLEAQFLRAQRLESVGMLASGVAHDLNNVLTPVSMSIQLFREKLTDPQDQELLKNLERSVRRGADIIRQILVFTRGVEGPLEPIEAGRILKEIARIASETFPRTVKVESRFPRHPWLVRGHATQLYQVLMNLCVNARDAMPEGGRLTLAADHQRLDDQGARIHVCAHAGSYVVLTVADTGVGMNAEVQERMFDPFFTTKAPGQGTGLGLATVHKIVAAHQGFLIVTSAPNQGTRIEIFLPALAESVTAATHDAGTAAAAEGHGELVLLVDDEAIICRFALKVLQKAGFRCLCAGNGQEAVDLFQQHRDEIWLVVTDLMMPVMGGDLAIRSMMQMRPDLRFVAMSGLLEQDLVAGLPKDRVRLLAKPFEAEQLLGAIQELTANPGPTPGAPSLSGPTHGGAQ